MSSVGYVGPVPAMDKSTPPQPAPRAAPGMNEPPPPSYGVAPPPYEAVAGGMPPADPGAPVAYEHRSTTTTTGHVGGPARSSEPITFHPEYLKTIPGMLQVAECVLSVLTFICACINGWGGGQSWVRFVSMSAFLTTLIYLILTLMGLLSRFVYWRPVRFIYYSVLSVLYLIAFIVAAAFADRAGAIAASAFFAFVATVVYSVDTFLQYREWRRNCDEAPQQSTYMTTTVYTTTTTTNAPPGGAGMPPPIDVDQGYRK